MCEEVRKYGRSERSQQWVNSKRLRMRAFDRKYARLKEGYTPCPIDEADTSRRFAIFRVQKPLLSCCIDVIEVNVVSIMASGIEVAGIALAVFPIVVQSFGSYAQGIETIKKLRRQRRELESYVRVLKTQRVYYLDTIEELLDGIVELDALNEMLQDFDSISWQASEYEQRLQDRLGRSYNSFLESCSELRDSLKSIERKLQASHDTSSSSVSFASF